MELFNCIQPREKSSLQTALSECNVYIVDWKKSRQILATECRRRQGKGSKPGKTAINLANPKDVKKWLFLQVIKKTRFILQASMTKRRSEGRGRLS